MATLLGSTSKGRYGTRAVSIPSLSPRLGSAPDHGPAKPSLGASARAPGDLEKEYIYNLQQQIYFLELEMKYLRDNGGAPAAGGAPAPRRSSGGGYNTRPAPGPAAYLPTSGDGSLEDTMAHLRNQTADMEARQAAQLHAAEQRLDRAVQGQMTAQMAEQRAREEQRRAEAIVDKLREEHTVAMSQVVGESVALQRQLEHKAVTEKTLRADVNALTEQLHELKKRFASYDVDMRELAERLAEASSVRTKQEREVTKLRAELTEHKAISETSDARANSLQSMLGALKGEVKESRDAQSKAEGESRMARMELEGHAEGHSKLQDDCKFLIMENAQLQSAATSSAAAAAHAEKERQRLLDEMDRSKVERVLGKFMFRKQREKYLETAELHRETKDQIAENFRELARASQRYDDLDRELRTARRRAAVKEDHYGVQEVDASKLAQENRLLLERATQMGSLIELLRADLTTAQREGDEAKAQAKILKDRDALARVLQNFRVDDFRSLMDTNNQVAGQIQSLLGALTTPAPAVSVASSPALNLGTPGVLG
ncbi:hypothetical protein T492DRAFT_1070185 [Pavlovales sp. CCMP2436]|nr:hypothetical protein T492DRAFT_1070185 [Pavlovales sp. CCMP2436]